ncbi:S1 family peptidase [Streptomyces sp. URMC 123]|uniref:S1 family peptidase n=1 Tax=Streptomyces sp. URMC 123 TaxID=3423403 RepID=UPI003F1D4DDE
MAAPAPARAAVDFAGAVSLSNCSGALVRMPDSLPDDPALVLTNGHCVESGMPDAGTVLVDRPSTRDFGLLGANGDEVANLRATKLVYATMTDTDVALYQLGSTYEAIRQRYGITARRLAAARPGRASDVSVVSGYWKRVYTCRVDGFPHRLRESQWTWRDSVRYSTPGCEVIGGTSGSPVVDTATGDVVAVNNTRNESGGRCTLNNPCEVDEKGRITVRRGAGYAQQTHQIPACVGLDSKLDLERPGCELPKPRAERRAVLGR